MNFDEAIASHEKWKIKLKDYIKSESTHAVIDPLVVEKDNLCDFGKWIYNEGLNLLTAELMTDIKVQEAA